MDHSAGSLSFRRVVAWCAVALLALGCAREEDRSGEGPAPEVAASGWSKSWLAGHARRTAVLPAREGGTVWVNWHDGRFWTSRYDPKVRTLGFSDTAFATTWVERAAFPREVVAIYAVIAGLSDENDERALEDLARFVDIYSPRVLLKTESGFRLCSVSLETGEVSQPQDLPPLEHGGRREAVLDCAPGGSRWFVLGDRGGVYRLEGEDGAEGLDVAVFLGAFPGWIAIEGIDSCLAAVDAQGVAFLDPATLTLIGRVERSGPCWPVGSLGAGFLAWVARGKAEDASSVTIEKLGRLEAGLARLVEIRAVPGAKGEGRVPPLEVRFPPGDWMDLAAAASAVSRQRVGEFRPVVHLIFDASVPQGYPAFEKVTSALSPEGDSPRLRFTMDWR